MKHFSLLLCASALTASLSAQHLPENTHCLVDSALMTVSNWGRTDYQKMVFTYDDQNSMLGMLMTEMFEDEQGIQTPWSPRMRTTYTPGTQGKPELAIQESIDWETGEWTEDSQTRYEYDANGNCIKTEEYSHPWTDEGISSEYELSTVLTYKFDEQNRLIENGGAFYSDGVPDYQFKNTYAYGPHGITTDTGWRKDGGEWYKSFEVVYDYSDSGLLLLETTADLDEDGNWQYRSRRENEYDEKGHLKKQTLYYRQLNDEHPKLEQIFYYTCNDKGLVVTEELLWADETDFSQRIEYTYDNHDDIVNMKQYQRSYDPETWETLPYLVLHEEETYYYQCLGVNSLNQLHAQPKQHGCIMINGKMVIVSGDKCFDLMGRVVK